MAAEESEQHQSAEHHAQEEVESAFVCLAHAFADPGTVMVVSFDAAIAILAMARLERADDPALLAIFLIGLVMGGLILSLVYNYSWV
jgi:hypothetical protein